jgi:hypothetical protein
MSPSNTRLAIRLQLVSFASIMLALLACTPPAGAQSAYVRVSQAGYETGETPFRAYLMSEAAESGATFKVINSKGAIVFSGNIGALAGSWSHSKCGVFVNFLVKKITAVPFRHNATGTHHLWIKRFM